MNAPVDPFGEFAVPTRATDTASSALGAALSVLRSRWLLVCGVALAIFLAAAVYIVIQPPRYDAAAKVRIDPSPGAAVGQVTGDRADQGIIDTEITALQSRELASIVVDKLNLLLDPVLGVDIPPPGKISEAQRRARAIETLLSKQKIERDKGTYIVTISYRSVNPEAAAAIANAFAEQYIALTTARRAASAIKQRGDSGEQLATLAQQSQQVDQQLAQYRAASGIGSPAGGGSATEQQITSLAGQLATAESDAVAARSKLAVAQRQVASNGIGSMAAVLDFNVISQLRAKRSDIVERQGEIDARYGPKHIESVKIHEQLDAIDRQIADETQRVLAKLVTEADTATARAASLRGDMERLRARQASETRASVMADTYQREADAAHKAYSQLAEQTEANTREALTGASQAVVVERAVVPPYPSPPGKKLLLAAALFAALLGGTGSGFTAELLDKGLRTDRDLEAIGLSLIASIPQLGRRQRRNADGSAGSPADTLLEHPASVYSEAFRGIRRALMNGPGDAPKVVALVSALPNEGKTSSALALARVMAMAGDRVLVMDTDLRRANLVSVSGVEAGVGLVEVMRGGASLETAIVPDKVENLHILPVTRPTFTPDDLFGAESFGALLDALRPRYDRIVIDTPPILGVTDARSVVAAADAVVLVIKWGDTPKSAVRLARGLIVREQAYLAGACYSMVKRSADPYGLYNASKYKKYYEG